MRPVNSGERTRIVTTVATLGLLASGLAAIYTVVFIISGFANFASIRPYLTIIVVIFGFVTNLTLLRRGRAGAELKDAAPLLLVSLVITLVIVVPIVSAGFDLTPHTGR